MSFRVALTLALLSTAAGCKKYSLLELMNGAWSGTANDASGASYPMTAAFTYSDEPATPAAGFTGSVDVNGYIWEVNGAESDKKSAEVQLYNPLFPSGGSITKVTLEDDQMKGDYTMPDIVYQGTFTLTLIGGDEE